MGQEETEATFSESLNVHIKRLHVTFWSLRGSPLGVTTSRLGQLEACSVVGRADVGSI